MKKIIAMILSFVMLFGTATIGVPEEGVRLGFGLTAYAAEETSDSDLLSSDTDVSGTDAVTSGTDISEPEDPAPAEIASGTCGDNLTWVLTDDGKLTISGSGNMYNWSSYSNVPWYNNSTEIKNVEISGAASIGDYAFSLCRSLASVTIPDSVTSIGNYAFSKCDSLLAIIVNDSNANYKDIDGVLLNKNGTILICCPGGKSGDYSIPIGVTAIGDNAFIYCSSLESVTIPDSVTSIGDYAFYNCASLKSVTIPDSVTSIGDSAFFRCTSLASVTIGNSVTTIGNYAFYDCDALTDVYYGGTADEWKAITIGKNNDDLLFATLHCVTVIASGTCGNDLTWVLTDDGKLSISGSGKMKDWYSFSSVPWNSYRSQIKTVEMSGATSIGNYAFEDCNSLALVTIPVSVTSVGYRAFLYCDSLVSVTIPDSVTAIGDHAFANCGSLALVTIGEGVEAIEERAFSGCKSLLKINVDANNEFYADIEGVLCNKKATTLICWPGGKKGTAEIPNGVTLIGDYAFEDCDSLASVTIPDSVTSIGDYAFLGCDSLASVTIGNSVTSIGDGAFSGYGNLQTAIYHGSSSDWQKVSVGSNNTYLTDHLFFLGDPTEIASGKCGKGLDWVLTDDGVLTITGSGKMYSWSSESDVQWNSYRSKIRVIEMDGAETIGNYAFSDCDSLASVTIPDSVSTIGNSAFSDCTSLAVVAIGNSVTSIGGSAFSYCYSLESVSIPDSVTSIGNSAFRQCTSLASVTIPNRVTSIGSSAFYNCTSLAVVAIGNSVTSIGGSAFSDCTSLASVTIPNSVTSIGSGAFSNCDSLASVTIPDSLKSISSSAFNGCISLTSVTIPYSVKTISDSAFHGSYAIEDVYYIGTEEEWEAVTIDANNAPILDANIHFEPSDILYSGWCGKDAQYTFDRSGKLSITGSGEMYNWSNYSSSTAPWNSYSLQIKEVSISGVTSIGDYAFYDCYSLASVTIPDSVATIGSSAFSDCTSLASVTLPDSVTSIGNSAFNWCNSLKTVYYSGIESEWDAISVGWGNEYLLNATIYFAVSDLIAKGECGGLEWELSKEGVLTLSGSDAIPDYSAESPAPWSRYASSVKSAVLADGVTAIGDNAFASCAAMTSVYIPGSVSSIGDGAFDSCFALTTVDISKNVTSIGSGAFSGCSALTAITVDSANTKYKAADGVLFNKSGTNLICFPAGKSGEYTVPAGVTRISDYAFSGCGKLTAVTIPDSVQRMGIYAFAGCSSLAEVTLPAALTDVDEYAFSGCASLRTVNVPVSVTQINGNAFSGCSSLSDIYYSGTSAEWEEIIIRSGNSPFTSAKVHCAAGEDEDLTLESEDESVKIVIPDGETEVTADTELNVDPITISTEETKTVFAVLDELGEGFMLYDITLTEDGREVQPSGEVTVRIKVPDGYNAEKCKVYHVSSDGTAENMNAVVEDGYFVFITSHFSYYAIVEGEPSAPSRLPGDINSDGKLDMKDSTVLRRYLAGWDVTINESNADVNGDGEVNLVDSTILRRHLAGWEGIELK